MTHFARYLKYCSYTVAILHVVLYLINFTAMWVLLIKGPWYIALPLLTLFFSPLFGSMWCILNQLENKLRVQAGLKPLDDRIQNCVARLYKLFTLNFRGMK